MGTCQLVLLGRWLQAKGFAFWSLGHCYSPEMDYKRQLVRSSHAALEARSDASLPPCYLYMLRAHQSVRRMLAAALLCRATASTRERSFDRFSSSTAARLSEGGLQRRALAATRHPLRGCFRATRVTKPRCCCCHHLARAAKRVAARSGSALESRAAFGPGDHRRQEHPLGTYGPARDAAHSHRATAEDCERELYPMRYTSEACVACRCEINFFVKVKV